MTARSWTSRCSVASTSSAAGGSSADVGSSSTRTRGCVVSTEPIATRCCCRRTGCAAAGRAARRARAGRGSPRPASHHVGGEAERLHSVGQLVLDDVGNEAGERVLPDDAHDVGEVAGPVLRVSRPSTTTRPASVPPVKCGTSPLIAAAAWTCRIRCGRRPGTSRPRRCAGPRPASTGRGAPTYRTLTSSKRIIGPPPLPVRYRRPPRDAGARGGERWRTHAGSNADQDAATGDSGTGGTWSGSVLGRNPGRPRRRGQDHGRRGGDTAAGNEPLRQRPRVRPVPRPR